MISTQPGSTSLSSFKIISLEEEIPKSNHGNDIGPFGDQDDEQVRDYSPIWPERPWVSDIWRGVAYRLFLNGGGGLGAIFCLICILCFLASGTSLFSFKLHEILYKFCWTITYANCLFLYAIIRLLYTNKIHKMAKNCRMKSLLR